jgi:secretion/DNA translocation related TadE-like protein
VLVRDRGGCRRNWVRAQGWLADDRGSASVVAVAVAGVWFALVAVGVQLGQAVVSRHQVAAAADLGALAAAGQLVFGADYACGRAAWVVGRMGGRLAECQVSGWEVTVIVSGEPSVFGAPSARARAGPTEE